MESCPPPPESPCHNAAITTRGIATHTNMVSPRSHLTVALIGARRRVSLALQLSRVRSSELLGHHRAVAQATRAPKRKNMHPTIATTLSEGMEPTSKVCAITACFANSPNNELNEVATAPAITLNV